MDCNYKEKHGSIKKYFSEMSNYDFIQANTVNGIGCAYQIIE
jgi:hypothetical protein